MWGHVRHVNPLKEHPERITKKDKKITERLNYDGIDFPVRENDSSKIEKWTTFALTFLVMEVGCFFQFMFLSKNLKI